MHEKRKGLDTSYSAIIIIMIPALVAHQVYKTPGLVAQ